jgi:hypothetical protein
VLQRYPAPDTETEAETLISSLPKDAQACLQKSKYQRWIMPHGKVPEKNIVMTFASPEKLLSSIKAGDLVKYLMSHNIAPKKKLKAVYVETILTAWRNAGHGDNPAEIWAVRA